MSKRIQILEHSSAQPPVDGFLNTPPAHAVGYRCIVGSAPSGAFVGHTDKIAWSDGTAWSFDSPVLGWKTWVISDGCDYVYNGTWKKLITIVSATAPNVDKHFFGAFWHRPPAQIFVLEESGANKYWIEITSPKVVT